MKSDKRRDSKGRLLFKGESQDASGRYCFRYTDSSGKRITVYSTRLTKTDPIPKGARADKSLREKEFEILERERFGIKYIDMTVGELVAKYLSLKDGVRDNTRANFNFVQNILRGEAFSKKRISDVRVSDAKAFFKKLQGDGRGYSTICSVRSLLKCAFQMAVEDEMLNRNPFEFKLQKNVVVNDSNKREAISKEDEGRFLDFVKADEHYRRYYWEFVVLFKTGVRISEFCGLTIRDIDFEEGVVRVMRQLQRTRDMQYEILMPKTECGVRQIPMIEEVKNAFANIIANRPKPKKEPIVSGHTGFLFLDKNEKPTVALHWEHYMAAAVKKYNRLHKDQLPKITPHICRHTFCSNMACAGMNPKALQYLMGHSEIGVTLNVYTHIKAEGVKEEMQKMGLLENSNALP